MPTGPINASSPSRPDTRDAQAGEVAPAVDAHPEPLASDEATRRDWVEADKSRPSLPEETADGLDEMDEEIRHQAEDLPPDTPGSLR